MSPPRQRIAFAWAAFPRSSPPRLPRSWPRAASSISMRPSQRYMPDLPDQHHATTLRQLLTHRGGIRHYAAKDDSAEAPGPIDRRLYLSNADILAVFINDPLIARPGERVSYSTFGYTLASIVLETAAKLPFLELVQRDIATPLGLATLGGDAPMSLVTQPRERLSPGRQPAQGVSGLPGQVGQHRAEQSRVQMGRRRVVSQRHRCGALRRRASRTGQAVEGALDTLFTVYTERNDRSPPLGLGLAHRRRRSKASALASRRRPGRRPRKPRGVSEGKAFHSVRHQCDADAGDVNGPSAQIADVFSAA